MLEYINTFIPFVPGRAMPRYHEYMKHLEFYFHKHYSRFLVAYGHEHRGIGMLRQILNNVDYEWLVKNKNDLTGYLNHIRFIKTDLDNVFDSVSTGRNYKNLFFGNDKGIVNEYLCIVDDVNCMEYLPFDQPWATWEPIRPIRIWNHDSPEFSLNIMHDKVHFNKISASHAVVLIDVVALVFKYYKWRYHGGVLTETREIDDLTQQFFLHKYVICPLLYDMMDIWLIDQIADSVEIANYGDIDDIPKGDDVVTQYSDMGIRHRDGKIALVREFQNIKKKNTKTEVYLNSRILFTGSLLDRMTLSVDRWNVPQLIQFEYMELLKDLDLLHICLQMYQLNTDQPRYKNILRELRIQYNRMRMRKPWNRCVNRHISKMIETSVNAFGDIYI